jgi:topoisomerase IA-like protein
MATSTPVSAKGDDPESIDIERAAELLAARRAKLGK